MAVISKEVALDVARQITRSKLDQANLLVYRFTDYLVIEYNKTLPLPVIAFYKQMPHYIETKNYIRVAGNGFNYEVFSTNVQVIVNKSADSFEPNSEVAAILLEMYNEYKAERKAYNQLVIDVQNALIQLRTYKNIETHFPDAVKFLPSKSTVSVAINLDNILDRLK